METSNVNNTHEEFLADVFSLIRSPEVREFLWK